MDIFSYLGQEELKDKSPLALKVRPGSLDDFYGQEEILGPGKLLRQLIQEDALSSAVFHGPPGTGKTTLATVIARVSRARFVRLNAVMSGVKDIREVIEGARQRLGRDGRRTILFIDEIHRFNRAQQDALLPPVEDGTVILIGATTENPYFTVNSPLLSRSRVFSFKPLGREALEAIIARALGDKEKGLGGQGATLEKGALDFLVEQAGGDARVALNALETAVLLAPAGEGGGPRVTREVVEESLQQKIIRYDRQGDNHYDVISAFIKSIRGSDPDAALYWLARMLKAGEDPNFIARRLLISASEDVGNADPQALVIATAAAQSLQMVGLPEGRITLAQAVTYLACAPKSNAAYLGLEAALGDISQKKIGEVPPHLRSTGYPGAKNLGHGRGYLYPHDFPGSFVPQDYLPGELKGAVYYNPRGTGEEKAIKERLEQWWPDKKRDSLGGRDGPWD